MEQITRDKALNIPMSEAEMQVVKHEAEKLGISVANFIRLLIKNWSDGITFEKKGIITEIKH